MDEGNNRALPPELDQFRNLVHILEQTKNGIPLEQQFREMDEALIKKDLLVAMTSAAIGSNIHFENFYRNRCAIAAIPGRFFDKIYPLARAGQSSFRHGLSGSAVRKSDGRTQQITFARNLSAILYF